MNTGSDNRHPGVLAALLVAVWLAAGSSGLRAAQGEYQIKAAFLYNFTQYVTWPRHAFDGRHAPFRLCLLGHDPFGILIDITVEGQRADGHPIHGRRLTALEQAEGCHIIFLGHASAGALPDLIAWARRRPVLTIGEQDGFAAAGGAVELAARDGRIRLLINRAALRRSGLEANANLLRLADIVEEEP